MTQPLFERFRPRTLADVIGQDKAVRQVQGIIDRTGFGGRAVWISGASGTGKTTLARIIAGTLADEYATVEHDSGADFGAAELDSMRETMGMYGLGKGGRAWIINEVHTLRPNIVVALNGVLERLPGHCVVCLTTTKVGEETMFDDKMDAHPLYSRCIPITLTNQGLAQAFAERALTIARAEGLDGQPIGAYVKLAQKCRNNFRAMLTSIEAGCMIGGGA